jgi:hypothetical protein
MPWPSPTARLVTFAASAGTSSEPLANLNRAGGQVWRAYTLKEALGQICAPGLTLEDVTVLMDRSSPKHPAAAWPRS